MFARSKVALTFFCLVVALGLATVSEANSLVHSPRDHAQLNRMIKKRAGDNPLLDIFQPAVGAAGAPTASVSTDPLSSTSTSASSAVSTDGASASLTQSLTEASTSESTTVSSSTTTSESSSTASSESSSSSSSSTSTTSESSSTSTPAEPTQTPDNGDTPVPSSRSTSTKFVTATDTSVPSPSSGANTVGATAKDDNKVTKTTLTVIIAVAASIGGVALAWTLFRKWKLRPSSNFDDRMQPIDWQPTGPEDSGLPTHRRAGSTASHGSFHSGDGHGYGSNHGHGGLDGLPEHDFTAGPTTLAPVGGYADLQRGPSPQPSMSELSRGPSMNRQQQYGAYDYNNGTRY